jgi:hypothetical protein
VKSLLTPLFELCPIDFVPKVRKNPKRNPSVPTPEEVIAAKVVKLSAAIGDQPCLLDLEHIGKEFSGSDGRNLWLHIVEQGLTRKMRIVPVTGFNKKGIEFQKLIGRASERLGEGACIRLRLEDFQRTSLQGDIAKLLEFLQLSPEKIDMILDFQLVDVLGPSIPSVLRKLPLMENWRSLTFVGGSFPKDLSDFRANDTYILRRLEWEMWKGQVLNNRDSLPRVPNFGDYTVQHPIYREPVSNPHVSASIRYTSSEDWIVFRGEWIGKKGGFGSAQYPAEAQLLIERVEYSGSNFSFGDDFVMKKAVDGTRPGNVKDWLVMAINHHITRVIYQLIEVNQQEKVEIAAPETVTIAASQ